ncbi:hypothetical protein N7451_008213 [Penicillium sp. IBT 35674x]|nr:hypothetical protein N7451_008213 [Penicillium sp. IBT 35674x]
MDALSSATSVIAVIQLTGSLVKLCGGYIREVKDARDEIFALQQAITGLQGTLQDLLSLLQSNNGIALPTSSRLATKITDCLSNLQGLEASLDPGKGKKLMRRIGVRALKWPLKRMEVQGAIQNLERYKSSFLLSLQVDHTSLIVSVAQNADRVNQNIDLAKLEGAMEAGFESFANRNEVQCLQGTRTELLQNIKKWATSPSQKSIFWLKGMAGTGKSTISRTVAGSLKDTNYLGASFFFKRGEGDRGNAKKLFPTLVRQLMVSISGLRSGVQKALDDDPDIASKSLKEQFEKLLLQPLLYLDHLGQKPQTAVIVIDALDECEHDQDIRNILQLLPFVQKAKTVRLRIFLTSRPELPINLGFAEITDHEYQDLALHEIPEEVNEHDIRLFLHDRFTKIKNDRNIAQDWPGDDIIQTLVKMSVPVFISAATVCRYIESSKWEPKSRLMELLRDQAKYASRMDKTYQPILTRLLDDQENDESEQQQLLQEFQQIVGVIIFLAFPLSINALSLFLGIGADQISNRLDSFRSVLRIPGDRDQPIRILHLSFRDFLVQSRTKFLVDELKKHKEIARSCLNTMWSHLQKNICKLGSPGTHRTDIDPQYIRQYLPSELQYSCRYWIHHLGQSQALSSEIEGVRLFLQRHFLHWVEAMSLLGLVSEVVGMLDLLHMVIPRDRGSVLYDFLHDAKRFVRKNRQIADEAPLQIYYAGLVFAPRTAIIRTEFKLDLPILRCQFPQLNEGWSAELQALEGHSDSVTSVAFSPNGRLLASGSHDDTVRLWNTATGALMETLDDHSVSVWSVAFSPDGRLLASGSHDGTVRLWNTATGAIQETLEGHSGLIRSVAFSPDGRLLASGSYDKTVRLWKTTRGALQETLDDHSNSVTSVAFSHDGRLLASGSHDDTVRLWDTETGALQQTLKGHSNSVTSVAFSPDGHLLASGSNDDTLRLWDTETGTLQQTLKGHLCPVTVVAFSPNSHLLASGSHDYTVRLWDTETGALQQTLEGHSNLVTSVAFSPDGRLLASGSDDDTVRLWDTGGGRPTGDSRGTSGLTSSSHDKTVRLWNTATGALQETLEGHLDLVRSVVFSPDGRLLASSFYDRTVQLWDAATGILQQTLDSHSVSDTLVVFSPDGRLLASGSYDDTVRLWDTETGALQQTLKGHLCPVTVVAFSPDGRLLASGSHDNTLRLWDTETGTLQQTLKGHLCPVTVVAFSPNSHLLASGSHDDTVRLWDTETGALQQTLEGHSNSVTSVAFSPDGRLLASGSDDDTVRLWDTETGALEESLKTRGIFTRLEFSQQGSYLITNLGTLGIQSEHENHSSNSDDGNSAIFIEEQWINLNGKSVLWLPPDFRASCSAIHGNSLALGHASGRISFLRFCL